MRALWMLTLSLAAVAGCTVGGPRDGTGERIAYDASVSTDADRDDGGVGACEEGATLGQACESGAQCNDGCFCNGEERCVEGVCEEGPGGCDDGVDCTMNGCDEESDRCMYVPDDASCADGDACNGAEVCNPRMGCVSSSPLYCNDEDSCTFDACNPEVGCTHTPRDLDGDGFTDGRCGGDDCNDDPRDGIAIFPGADEDCTNRRDDNCDGMRDFVDTTCVPTNDTCETAQWIAGPGTYSGATRGLASDVALRCRDTGADAFFRFELAETMDVRAIASGGGGTAIGLRRAAQCEAGPDLGCNDFVPASLLERSLPAGEYVLVVKQSSPGIFDLNVRFEPPTEVPPVDLCGADTVDISEGGTFSGMFLEVDDDYRLSCHSGSWRDAAYRFTTTERQDVSLSASATGSGFTTAYLTLVRDCDDAESTLVCRSGRPSEVQVRDLPAGTYWVILEASSAAATQWTLDATITDPAPRTPGDVCGTGLDITSSEARAPLATADLDTGTSCGGTSTAYRDVYFAFDLEETRDVSLTTTAPTGSTFVSLTPGACGMIGSEARCRSASGMATQSFRSLTAGRYFVTVSTIARAGDIVASMSTAPPTPIPPNDRCDGAIDISPPSYSSRDTLIDFEDDVMGTACSRCPDAFYRFTLTEPREFVSSVRRAEGATSASIQTTLRASCSSGTTIASDNGNPSGIAERLEAGTYYLIVESTSSTVSDYEIRVSYF